ncbi:MAG: hypothetical protein MI892_31080 [Desulfobacterales bacterium]|nr:hypothetical protein [Desulfobacterales bacterium]
MLYMMLKVLIRSVGLFTIVILVHTSHANADTSKSFIDYHGITVFYGHSNWTDFGPDPVDDYEWTSVNYVMGKHLTNWLDLETWLGVGYLDTDNHGDTPTLELRILADFHYKWMFIKLGGGAAHLFEDHNLPGLAESTVHSIISGSAGFRFQFNETGNHPIHLTLAYGVEHMSAPLKNGDDGDDGWNTGGARVSLTWAF